MGISQAEGRESEVFQRGGMDVQAEGRTQSLEEEDGVAMAEGVGGH